MVILGIECCAVGYLAIKSQEFSRQLSTGPTLIICQTVIW